MNTIMPYCVVNIGEIKCYGVRSYRLEDDKLLYIELNNTSDHVLFETKTPLRVICSGSGFEVFIWGVSSYFLWFFTKRDNVCILLKGVITPLTHDVYYVGETVSLPKLLIEKLEEIIYFCNAIRKLIKTEDQFFLIDSKLVKDLRITTLVSISENPVETLINYVKKLLAEKIGDRETIEHILKYMLERKIPLQVLEDPKLLIHFIKRDEG